MVLLLCLFPQCESEGCEMGAWVVISRVGLDRTTPTAGTAFCASGSPPWISGVRLRSPFYATSFVLFPNSPFWQNGPSPLPSPIPLFFLLIHIERFKSTCFLFLCSFYNSRCIYTTHYFCKYSQFDSFL